MRRCAALEEQPRSQQGARSSAWLVIRNRRGPGECLGDMTPTEDRDHQRHEEISRLRNLGSRRGLSGAVAG